MVQTAKMICLIKIKAGELVYEVGAGVTTTATSLPEP
jgi:hypothetical protein